MNLTNNKDLNILAIDNYSGFSMTQKQILKTLINFENEVPSDVILNITGLSRQAFHFSMKRLLDEQYVTRHKIKVFLYKINKIKMLQIIENYHIQQSLIKK